MEILIVLGLAVILGQAGGKLLEKIKVPQVVGFILMGLLLGKTFTGVLGEEAISSLMPLTEATLGVIGFMIGGELKKSVFAQFGRQIFSILLVEVFATYALVFTLVMLFTDDLVLALLFGALATATAPAATVDVLWEYKSKGPLTTTLLAIVGLDDALALIVFGFSVSYAKALLSGRTMSFLQTVSGPLLEIGGSIAFGIVFGVVLAYVLKYLKDEKQFLPAILGFVLLLTGLAKHFHLSQILSCMFMGIAITNLSVGKANRAFRVLSSFTGPLYIVFFVTIGSRLNVALLPQMGLLGVIYIVARITGKVGGANIGARIGKAPETVRKYLGLSLFSQAGIAIGLAMAIANDFQHLGPKAQHIGIVVLNVITATTFVVQMIGPPCVKLAISKAGEIPPAKG